MSLESKVQYLLDRLEIQDLIARYGLGQDFQHTSDDMMTQWSKVFAPDAIIDYSDVGFPSPLQPRELAELMRTGADGGMTKTFTQWQHLEMHAVVTIDGDKASSISPHLHTHEKRCADKPGNILAAGYFYDDLERRPEGWRIVRRRLKQLYVHDMPREPGYSYHA